MLNNQFETVGTVVRPYYKYKKDAYNKIREVAVLLLKESDFFIRNPMYTESLDLTFGNDISKNLPGSVNFYVADGSCVLSIIGNRVAGGLDMRARLTHQEDEILSKSLALLFKDRGDKSVSDVLQSQTGYWLVTENYCEFVGASGIHYFNKD